MNDGTILLWIVISIQTIQLFILWDIGVIKKMLKGKN